jgi:carboxyl-terminal processing protease
LTRRSTSLLALVLLGAAGGLSARAQDPKVGAKVHLTVASEPSDSAVYVRYGGTTQDRFLGRTSAGGALEKDLDAGPVEVVVFKDGFVCKVEPLDLRTGGAARLEVRLTPDVEVPRGIVLKNTADAAFVRDAAEGQELYVATLAHVVRFYVEERHPLPLVDRSVRTLVDVLEAIRRRELLLRRELPEDARRRYYGDELDLTSYPALVFERDGATAAAAQGGANANKARWSIAAGGVGLEGTTEAGDLDSHLEMLQRVWTFVRHTWDKRGLLSDAVITRCLVEGLIGALDDEHTHFLTPAMLQELTLETEGTFGGVGLVVGVKDGQLVVITPMDGTPGQRAGILAGDLIVSIDGQPAEQMTLKRAIDSLRGPVDAPVELVLRRTKDDGTKEERRVTLVRAKVEIRFTAHRMLEPGIGYLRISSFMHEGLSREVRAAIKDLTETKGARGLVIDLRNNPGGLLDEARAIADLFVPRATIVSTRTRIPGESRTLAADPASEKFKLPIVVLINKGSASASEILAGTLREHQLCTLVGERSFGKGSVQRVLPLDPFRCAIALTVATYHLPSGMTPHKVGVAPDEVVTLTDEEVEQVARTTNYGAADGSAPDAQTRRAIEVLRGKIGP